ncbi:glycoside hydrolase superfamily [Protomyces lactucae-debilis]|uniref:chitinase n=1 Tax=Protomyces lactucae-debilis TaxID=2754530 RepID=A0A1Y2EPK0_PROLT|nr:glycoside hydrolase superfamily [Protomyces lactucae-debilis]ORY73472.1 glycoside hydrolase superfamily [Protomyces lactucae-debilis]
MRPCILLSLVTALALEAQAAYNRASSDNIVIYWGQTGGGNQTSLATTCASSGADIVVLSFLTTFFGPGGLPVLNFASHCSEQFPGTNLLKCDAIARGIQTCQDLGVLVLLSLGGAVANVGFSSVAQASGFADTLWDLFGGGSSNTRPFGTVVLNGFDLDIEHGSPEHYTALVTQLQRHFQQSGRTYYMAAAPQCPFPDATLGKVLDEAPFDFVFVQHYNNPSCAIPAGQGFNAGTWQTWAKTAPNTNVQLFVGVPAAPAAAGSGYVDAAAISTAMQQIKSQFGETRLGGVMFWDASFLSGRENVATAVKAKLGSAPAGPPQADNVAAAIATPPPAVPIVPPSSTAPVTTFVYVAGIGPEASPQAALQQASWGDGDGAPCQIEGQMQCRPTGAFATCDHGAWVIRACAPGTACRPAGDSIVCDYAGAPSRNRRKRAGQYMHEHEHLLRRT